MNYRSTKQDILMNKACRFNKTVPAVAFMLILTGCATHDYEIPQGALMERSAVEAEYDVDTEWWKAYGSGELDALVDKALARNIDLARAAISVNKALYRARQLGADLVPDFTANASAGTSGRLDTGAFSDSYSAGISLSYEIDLWNRLKDSADAGAWTLSATEQDLLSSRFSLVNSVVSAYFNLLYLKEAVAGTEESLGYYGELRRISALKYREGRTDRLELDTAEQSVLAARNSLNDLKMQQITAEQTLRILLNMGPDEPVSVSGSLPGLIGVDLSVPVNALSLRPDVRAAEYRLLSSFRNMEASRKSIYPSVTIGAALNASSGTAADLFSAPVFSGTVRLNLPFLQYNTLKWNIKSSEADFEDAKLVLEKSVNTALNEVSTYYASYQNALEALKNQKATLEAEERIVRYYEVRYAQGASELKDLVSAKRSAVSTRLTLLKDRYNALKYENAVFEAMGGRLDAKRDQLGN